VETYLRHLSVKNKKQYDYVVRAGVKRGRYWLVVYAKPDLANTANMYSAYTGDIEAADTIARLEIEQLRDQPPTESFKSPLQVLDGMSDMFYVDLPKNKKRLLVYFFI
jgi:hypothetical protein